jgi:hypothetical protein
VNIPGQGVIVFGALGLAVTYASRMWRALRRQSRDRGELA